MTHREKVDRLIAELSSRGVNEYTTAPPAWRAAWALGLKVPPPHFLGFALMVICCGLFFGVLWGAAMYFMLWSSMGWLFSAVAGAVAGILFGVAMAWIYRRAALKLSLPRWQDYPSVPPDSASVRA